MKAKDLIAILANVDENAEVTAIYDDSKEPFGLKHIYCENNHVFIDTDEVREGE